MPPPTPQTLTKVSSTAAKEFIQTYYPTLNNPTTRQTLSSFYTTSLPTDISLNGNLIASPAAFQETFVQQMPEAHYEVQSYDCHVVNANYNIGLPMERWGDDESGGKCCLLVLVSGYVKYGTNQKEAKMRGFTEHFVLIPNYEPLGKRHLIQSQNFRMVL